MTTKQLNEAIKHIQQNLNPGDVFPREVLIDWVRQHEEPGAIFSATQMITAIRFSVPEQY